jgi:hypothetical protein
MNRAEVRLGSAWRSLVHPGNINAESFSVDWCWQLVEER